MAKNSLALKQELLIEGRIARIAGESKATCPYQSEKYLHSAATFVKRNVKYWIDGWESADTELKEKSVTNFNVRKR